MTTILYRKLKTKNCTYKAAWIQYESREELGKPNQERAEENKTTET